MKALTVGGAMIDTIAIIASDRIERMTMLNAESSFLLLEEGRKTEASEVTQEQLLEAGLSEEEIGSFTPMKGTGCQNCADTGCKGRVALYEVMLMGETLKEFVLNGASAMEIKKEAIRQGMCTLRRSALNKLVLGTTTLDEVLSNTASDR